MASIGAGCSLAKLFKILLVFCCIFFVYEYIPDTRKTDTIYTSNGTSKGPYRIQWPKRTQSRHCFDGVTDPPKNTSTSNMTVVSNATITSAAPKGTEAKSDFSEVKEVMFVNVHNITQRLSAFNPENSTSIYTSKTESDGVDIKMKMNNLTSTSQINGDSDHVKDITAAPETGCNVPCPAIPPGLNGPIEVNLTEISLKDLESRQYDIAPGGHFAPRNCKPKDKVAVVIPYRDRESHLAIFLNNMHPFLMKQQIEYQIYIVEQRGHGKFNRASLMNVGYVEANRQREWNCFIFHDVDLLPLDDRNLYTCPSQPRHLSAAIDKFQFKLPYPTIFGGVSALTTEQFKKVNGFSNSFWGWGGEDDDMANRINYHNYHISRYPMSVARYTMLNHEKENPNPKRYDILMKGKRVFNTEGLNNLQYTLVETQAHRLYTLLLVELHPPS